jgi:hypothetical protein
MKRQSFLILALILINSFAIGFFYFRYMSSTAPLVGGDIRYFIPRLLDNYLYQRINGIFSVHWYTPSFAGGEPVYANPQDIQYSLPQLLVFFFNPWRALRLSMAFYVVVGFIGFYYFFKYLLELNPFASILGAVFSVVNGFYIQHMVAGHVTFQPFPLFGVILIIIFNSKIPHWISGMLLSLLGALLIYSGSFQLFTFFFLAFLVTIPVIYLLKPSLLNWKQLFGTLLWGAGFSILICGSKLWAIYSLMKFSPRLASDQYNTTWFQGIIRIIYQLLGSMNIIPIRALIEGVPIKQAAIEFAELLQSVSKSPYSFAGLDVSLSPALLLLLFGGAISLLFHKPIIKAFVDKKRLIAEISLVFAILFVIAFSLAKGSVYLFLHQLPIMESLRANVRYTSAFIFPLGIVGAAIFNRWTRNWKSTISLLAVFILFNGVALATLGVYYQLSPEDQTRIFDIRGVMQVYPEIRYQGKTFLVDQVVPHANTWEVFDLHATDLIDPYEPLFKSFETHYQSVLHEGSVYDINNGYYNIINPTGYVYPEVNNTKPFDRIPVSDKANFIAFINRRPTNWKMPVIQQVLNWITPITLLSEFGTLLVVIAKKWLRFPKHKSTP